ncbi:hypothetical protein [Burkholderia anthina]|uniref:hypothetical protein n=1 Tax=Burkholderia anthina TaxID=179879 RepID=UPI0037C053C9
MRIVALFICLLCLAGIVAITKQRNRIGKALYIMSAERPQHASGEESWQWEKSFNKIRMKGYTITWAYLPLGFVFFLSLITLITGATSA